MTIFMNHTNEHTTRPGKPPARLRLHAASAATAIIALVPSLANAHADHGVAVSLSAGFAHPWGGLDHLLALAGIGLWAAAQSTRQWQAPLVMVLCMLLGAMITPMWGLPAMTEPLIATSVLLIGLALTYRCVVPGLPCVAAVSLFGWFHGAAHASALSGTAALAGMTLGSTSALALGWFAGVATSRLLSKLNQQKSQQWVGTVVALTGLGMLAQHAS